MKNKIFNYGVAVTLFVVAGCLQADALADTPSSTYEIANRDIPKQYERDYEFLEAIKYSKGADDAFDAKRAPHWDIQKIISFVSREGVSFSDVNGGFNGHAGKEDIRRALIARKGDIFVDLAHLAYIYAQPYKQYSELSFSSFPDGVIVHIAGMYNLTFKKGGDGNLQLTNCDYLEIEGE